MAKKKQEPLDRAPIRSGLDGLFEGATSKREKVLLAAAERAAIRYYYRMVAAMNDASLTGRPLALPDPGPMKKAVTEINRACANQKKPVLYGRKLTDIRSLFDFAAGIVPNAA